MKPDKAPIKPYLQKIRRDLLHKQTLCPAENIIIEYVAERLPDKEMEEIRSHVAVCDYCIERIRQKTGEGDSTAAEAPVSSEIIREDWNRFEKRIRKDRNPWPRAATMLRFAAAIVLVFTSALAGGFYLTRPAHYSLAEINSKVELRKLNTFRGNDPLALGVFALKNSDFNRANKIFTNYVNQNHEVFAGFYYLGVTLLYKAQSGLVARFRFRQVYIEQAIGHLQTALSLLDDNPHRAANCYWFLGKAYLMQGEMALAKAEFQKILDISEPGIKRKQASKKILMELQLGSSE